MPTYTLTDAYSAPITVAPGDVIQNSGKYSIYVCFSTPAADEDAIRVPSSEPVKIVTATSMRVRCTRPSGGAVTVAGGL